jgi:hypothetical protein
LWVLLGLREVYEMLLEFFQLGGVERGSPERAGADSVACGDDECDGRDGESVMEELGAPTSAVFVGEWL